MRILIVTDQFPPAFFGGMAQHAYHMTRYLGERHEVLVVLPQKLDACVEEDRFTVQRSLTMRFPAHDASRLLRLARSFRPDVIHACTAGLAFSTLSMEFPVVTRVVGNDFLRPWCGYNLPFRSVLYRLPGKNTRLAVKRWETRLRRTKVIEYLRDSRLVVANSEWTRDRLVENGIPVERIKTIVGGLDTETFQPCKERRSVRIELGLPSKSLVLMTAAILVRKKGIDTVIRVVGRLAPEWPMLRYVVVGEGEDGDYLRDLTHRLGVGKHVVFVGMKDQVELCNYYQASDIYVQVSRDHRLEHGYVDVETMGRTYFEAGACSVPVIGARVGGVPSVVKDGRNGLLVDDPEDEKAIASCIERLLRDESLRKRMGAEGLRRARTEFSWERVGAAFEDEMHTLAVDRSRPDKAGVCAIDK